MQDSSCTADVVGASLLACEYDSLDGAMGVGVLKRDDRDSVFRLIRERRGCHRGRAAEAARAARRCGSDGAESRLEVDTPRRCLVLAASPSRRAIWRSPTLTCVFVGTRAVSPRNASASMSAGEPQHQIRVAPHAAQALRRANRLRRQPRRVDDGVWPPLLRPRSGSLRGHVGSTRTACTCMSAPHAHFFQPRLPSEVSAGCGCGVSA